MIKRIFALTFISIIALVQLTGCSPYGARFHFQKPPEETAQVYLYRNYDQAYREYSISPRIAVNGQRLVYLQGGGYTVFEIPAGLNTITIENSRYISELNMDVVAKAGKTYFVNVELNEKTITIGPRDYDEVKADLSQTRFLTPEKPFYNFN